MEENNKINELGNYKKNNLLFYISDTVSNASPEVQALIHNQIYHNFIEKMIDPNHGHLAEELVNEDEFVPNDDG